ncbi:MAG TPA: hypothetical protein VMV89_10450 [Candidatus Paceibacterota bacterium]|nr:hypothetical protein [Candidatus Paceibacterota bacterium]
MDKKAKNPRLTGNRGFFEILLLNQKFVPTMPGRQPTRVPMDICPLACACFSMVANVVFIFFTFKPRRQETPFRSVCQIDFVQRKIVVGFACGAKLNLS